MKNEDKFDIENVEVEENFKINEEEMKSVAGGSVAYQTTTHGAWHGCNWEHAK